MKRFKFVENDELDNALLVTGTKKQPLIVSFSEYQGRRLLDIRKYYQDKEGGVKPTRKGVALNRTQYDAVSTVFADKGTVIDDWFNNDSSTKTAEIDALNEIRFGSDDCEIVLKNWHGLEMFNYKKIGNKAQLELNTNHKWINSLVEMSQKEKKLDPFNQIIFIFKTLGQSLSLIDPRNEYASEVIETVLGNWAIISNVVPDKE